MTSINRILKPERQDQFAADYLHCDRIESSDDWNTAATSGSRITATVPPDIAAANRLDPALL